MSSASSPPAATGRVPMVRGRPQPTRGRALAAALGAVALLALELVATRPSWREALAEALRSDPERVARALAQQLGRDRPRFGAVQAAGAGVRLEGGQLRLEVQAPPPEPADPGSRQVAVHVHVRAIAGGDGGGRLEACVYGRGPDRRTAVEEAATAYRLRALPAVLALAGGDATDARPFGGTEPWGLGGRRGFVGPVATLGKPMAEDRLDALVDAPLFAGFTAPPDGRGHLLKAVLLGKDGAWTRTLELDGDPTSVTDAPWSGAPAPAATVLVIRFASFRRPDRLQEPAAREEALRQLAALPAAGTACPLAPLPEALRAPPFTPGFCQGGRLLDCVAECLAGSGTACQHAAQELIGAPVTEGLAQALFVRGCHLGVASACTNAAAGLESAAAWGSGRSAACAVPAYRRACEQAGDPWGCTMLGGALAEGRGVARDAPGARAALERACRSDEADPACAAARRMLARLGRGE